MMRVFIIAEYATEESRLLSLSATSQGQSRVYAIAESVK